MIHTSTLFKQRGKQMNATAQKLADAVTIEKFRDGYELTAQIVQGINESNNQKAARVISGGAVVLNWIVASDETYREACSIVSAKLKEFNDEFDALGA